MRRLLTLCAALCLPVILSAQTIVGSWNFNGNALDGSGHNLNGTVHNATLTAGQAGIPNTAYKFNGINSHIDVPYDAILNLSTFTIQAMVRIDSFNSNVCQAEYIASRSDQSTSYWYCMSTGDNPFDNSCSTYSPNNTEFVDGIPGTPTASLHAGNYITPNVWYCHTVTYDGSKMKLYINGVLIDSVLIANSFNYSGVNIAQPILTFGYYPAGGTTFPYWLNGAIDNLTIWNGALTPTQVASLGCNTTTPCAVNQLNINTGYNPAINSVYAFGGQDQYWTITGMSAANRAVALSSVPYQPYAISPIGGWTNNTNSRWLSFLSSPNYATVVGVDSLYATTFTRYFHNCTADTFTFAMQYAADNWMDGIFVDGVSHFYQSINQNAANFSQFNTIPTFSVYLPAGNHRLDAAVFNYPLSSTSNPQGFNMLGTITGRQNSLISDTCTGGISSVNATQHNDTICQGSSVVLGVVGTGTMVWTPSTGLNATTGNTVTASPTVTTLYHISNVGGGCYVASDSILVVVKQGLGTTSFTNNLPVCTGDTIKLTASSTNTSNTLVYQWIDPNGTVTTGQNRIIPNATSANAGRYAFSLTNGSCIEHDTLTAVILPSPPHSTVGSNTPVCSGSAIGLSAASTVSGATYSWKGPNNFTSNLQAPLINAVPFADSGNYVVTTTAGGCSRKDTTHVSIIPSPVITATYRNPVCVGDSINIYANVIGGSGTYTWAGPAGYSSSNINVQLAHATAANAGNYIISSTGGNGCIGSFTASIQVNAAPPKPSASGTSPVCASGTLSLSATSINGATYIWTGPTGYGAVTRTATRQVFYPDSGAYIVGATLGGCTTYDTVHIAVLQAPLNVTYGSNSPVCAGDSIKITANNLTAGVSYSWIGPSISSNAANFNIPHVSTVNGGRYTLTVTYGGNCPVHDTLYVAVNPLPNKPTITVNSPICAGTTLSFNATATTGAIYSWTSSRGFNASIRNPTIPQVRVPDSGYYYVVATLNGCSMYDTTHVVVNQAPINVMTIGNTPLCVGDMLSVVANNQTVGVTYSWTGPNGFTSTQQNFNINNVTTANTGNYVVTATFGGCTVLSTLPIAVNPLPARPTISSNSPLCSGTNLSLGAVGTIGATYSWTGPTGYTSSVQNTSRTAVALTDSGYYIVKATLNGCSASDTSHVAVNPSPANVQYSSNSPICTGDALSLTASTTTAGVTYSWTGPNNFTSTTQTTSIPVTTGASAGKYALAVNYNACTLYDTLTVVIKPLPSAPTVGSNTPVCIGTSLNLTSFSTTAGVTYSWTGPNSYISATENPTIATITASGAGNYIAKATLNGCSTTATTTVVVNPIPSGTASSNSPVCEGGNLQLNSSVTPSTVTYNWTGPNGFTSAQQNPSLTGVTTAASGIYNLSLSLGTCTTVLRAPVAVTPLAGPPVVTISTPKDTVCGGDAVTFTAVATNAGSSPVYDWKVNGASTGVTTNIYTTSGLQDGNLVTCGIAGNAICQPVTTSNSNAIWMHVKLASLPASHIQVSPATYTPGTLVTFTAIVQGSSSCLTFQWRLNGVDIPRANSSSYASYALMEGDQVSLLIHSDCSCTRPDEVLTNVISLAVNNVTNAGNYKIYPNPAQDEVTIEGVGNNVQAEIYDMTGKQIWTTPVTFKGGSAKIHLSLPSGVYNLRLIDEKGNAFTNRLVILK